MTTIYHNPRCSKSRQTLALLEENGVDADIVEYLKTPPDAATLDGILKKLGKEPQDIVRRKESAFAELNLDEGSLSRADWIAVLVANPILIERPIVVNGDQARIGRPPESVLDIVP